MRDPHKRPETDVHWPALAQNAQPWIIFRARGMDSTDGLSHKPTLGAEGGVSPTQTYGKYMRYGWFPTGKFGCCSPKWEWLLSYKINVCPLYPNPSVRINSVLPAPAYCQDVYTSHDFFLHCRQAGLHPLSSFIGILGTRSLALQSI